MSELQTQTQHLERFTVDSISMEVRLSRCLVLQSQNHMRFPRGLRHLLSQLFCFLLNCNRAALKRGVRPNLGRQGSGC